MRELKVFSVFLSFLLTQPWDQVSAGAISPVKRSASQIGPINFYANSHGFSLNWKQCAWDKINENKDNGLIKACDFVKKSDDSVMKVTFDGDWRIYRCKFCCKRWFFTFNGAECSGPLPIDAVEHYQLDGTNRNHHQHHTIQGYCTGIRKGKVRVGINVGNCHGFGNADAHTGWNSVTRIIVEEFPATI